MSSVFEKELEELKQTVLKLSSLVEKAISDSIKSLIERDSKIAAEVIDGESKINTLDVEIDEECIRLIALRQPCAGDLRLITTAMKITTDLERIGDLAVDISERALELNNEPQLKPYIDIPRMAETVQTMLRDALDAFVKRDSKLARDVLSRDDLVDNLNYQIFNELMFFMIQDPRTVSRAVKITYISKYLERIADHATNIAEMVIYLVEGKIIRHAAVPDKQGGNNG